MQPLLEKARADQVQASYVGTFSTVATVGRNGRVG
jgi:hypothetical protein